MVLIHESKEEAQKVADERNREPLPAGKEKRTPFKVYKGSIGDKVRYAVAQAPMPATHLLAPEFGFNVELAEAEGLSKVESYLSKLSPEQLEAAKKFLGGN